MNSQPQHVFCLGLGGVGVSAVAKLYLAQGVRVSGSEANMTAMIADVVARGGVHLQTERVEDMPADIDLLVTTDDRPQDHPQLLEAQRRGIPIENFSTTLGRLMAPYQQRICIAGTNGKSTTSAMTGLLLAAAGLDPTVFVGSIVPEFNGNVRFGQGQSFVAEADEYHDHFLHYQPTIAVLNNVEDDHLDYFKTHERMVESFSTFVARLPEGGMLVANADDPEVMRIAADALRVITFGLQPAADVRATNIQQTDGQQSFTLMWNEDDLGTIVLPLPGTFNIMNALAAIAASIAAGVDPSTFATTLSQFHGIWRRFQILNPGHRPVVVSDYAHHPTAVRATLEGAKTFFPGRRIVAVFQPHHRSRLTTLFDDFTKCFSSADAVVIVEAYTVPGRDIPEATSRTTTELVQAIQAHLPDTTYLAAPEAVVPWALEHGQPNDVMMIMGAGTIWTSAVALAEHYGSTNHH